MTHLERCFDLYNTDINWFKCPINGESDKRVDDFELQRVKN